MTKIKTCLLFSILCVAMQVERLLVYFHMFFFLNVKVKLVRFSYKLGVTYRVFSRLLKHIIRHELFLPIMDNMNLLLKK